MRTVDYTPRQWLTIGLDVLKSSPWTKGEYEDPDTGAVCAVGALLKGAGIFDGQESVNAIAALRELDRQAALLGATSSQRYNDHPDTTKQDVIALYEKAIANCP
jgi:hypothetical protein